MRKYKSHVAMCLMVSSTLFLTVFTGSKDPHAPERTLPEGDLSIALNGAFAGQKYHQVIPRRLMVTADESQAKSASVQIGNLQDLPSPGLIILASRLDVQDEAAVLVNGNRYDIPAIVGGLKGKIIIPLQKQHLMNGENEIKYFSTLARQRYEVIDSRIETVEEEQTRITGWTYYQLSSGRIPESIDAFDFVMDFEDGYERKETDVPAWTKIGKVRHMKFDNDPIFLHSCYWWLYGQNRDVMENIYTKYIDRALEICKQGHINTVLIRWNTGLSLPFEAEWRGQCAEFIKKFHENGIKVGVYLAIGEIFWPEMFYNEPESKNWLWKNEFGQPIDAGWNPLMYIGDIKKKDFRDYILKRTELAINAGVDALYYDIPSGEVGDLISLILGIRELIHEKGKNLSVYTNVHGTWLVEEFCDITKSESFTEPGIWGGRWVHNAGQARFFYATGNGWKNLEAKYGHGGNSANVVGPGGEFVAGGGKVNGMTIGWQRPIAEAAAFQAHFSVAENNNIFETRLILKDSLAMAVWEGVGRYNKFLEENEDFYTDVLTVSKIGIVSPPDWRWGRELLNTLSEMNIMYDVLLLPRMNLSKLDEYCAKYKTIMVMNVPWMLQEQEELLRDYKARGGKIYTVGSSTSLQNLAHIHSSSALIENPDTKESKNELLLNLKKLVGKPIITIENASYVMSNIVKKKGTDRYIIHFINYSDPVENVRVTLNLDSEDKAAIKKLTVYSPDPVSKKLDCIAIKEKRAQFTIPELNLYTVVVVD